MDRSYITPFEWKKRRAMSKQITFFLLNVQLPSGLAILITRQQWQEFVGALRLVT